MRNKGASPDSDIGAVAARQHGVVTHAQLLECGLSRYAVSRWAEKGRLHRLHQGVYEVGFVPSSIRAHWTAAVLACGDGAVLSHASAAALWGFLRPIDGPADISVPTQNGRRKRHGIRLHRCVSLASDPGGEGSVTLRDGIPVTSPRRTIEDLRGVVPRRLYWRAVREAEVRGYLLALRDRGDRTRSDLERDFLAFCRRHGIPQPEVNVRIAHLEVDFLWRAERLIVETDGFRFHRGSVAFEDDHQRDLELRRLGYSVRHYTGAQLRSYPAEIAAELGGVLGPEIIPGEHRPPAS